MTHNATTSTVETIENDFEYDVSLSFAGENRDYVSRVATGLKQAGLKVHYDADEIRLGEDLYDRLADVYEYRSRYCVIFFSESYAGKMWTNYELERAQARALRDYRPYILPSRFDDVAIPHALRRLSCADLRRYEPQEFVDLILKTVRDPKQPDRSERMRKIVDARRRRLIRDTAGIALLIAALLGYAITYYHSRTRVGVLAVTAEFIEVRLSNSGWQRSAPVAYRMNIDGVPIAGTLIDGERVVDLEVIDLEESATSVPALSSVEVFLRPKHEELKPLCRNHSHVTVEEIQKALHGRHVTLEVQVRESGTSDGELQVQSDDLDADQLHDFIARWLSPNPPPYC